MSQCADCRYCNWDDLDNINNKGKFPCTRENCWVFPDDEPLKSNCYWERPSYQMLGQGEAFKLSKSKRGFYITTYIFNKLGLSNSKDLDRLYLFRRTYLDIKKTKFIADYDTFGPRIAKLLECIDTDGYIAKSLYEFYILGTLKCMRENNYEGASELYASMYTHLRNKFIVEYYKSTLNKPYIKTI